MNNFEPITLKIVDETGNQIFQQSVPFEVEMDVRTVMERAFILQQSSSTPDPLVYQIQYYGYSEFAGHPGYLGYEIESIHGKPSNSNYFWKLIIDGITSEEGADSMRPAPGSTVLWEYKSIADETQLTARTQVVHARRAARSQATA